MLGIRDGGCVFPGCHRVPGWCDAHHVVPWTRGGATDLDNLVLVCRRHQVLLHEGRWRLHRDPDGTWTTDLPARAGSLPGPEPP